MLSMIAAIGKNRELGQTKSVTGLPWHIPEDTRYFRDTTRGHCVIMGQKTFEALGRPLPNRTNIVLTQDSNFSPEGVAVAHSPEEAVRIAKKHFFFPSPLPLPEGKCRVPETKGWERGGVEPLNRRGSGLNAGNPLCPKTDISPLAGGENKEGEIFIIGGATIYSLFLPKADRLYLTHIDAEFPDADVFFPEYESIFAKTVSKRKSQDGHFTYTFSVLERE